MRYQYSQLPSITSRKVVAPMRGVQALLHESYGGQALLLPQNSKRYWSSVVAVSWGVLGGWLSRLCDILNPNMNTKQQKILKESYKKYRKSQSSKKGVLGFLRAFMPEIIYRTTRLEGERVTRRMTSSLFK